MFGLPEETGLKKQIPKNLFYQRFEKIFKGPRKAAFERDISRLYVINEISTKTINIRESKDVNRIFFILVELKTEEYDDKNIEILLKLFQKNTIAVLSYEGKYQLAAYNIKLIKSNWDDYFRLQIKGVDLKDVWDNFLIQIGDLDVEKDITVDDAIVQAIEKEKIEKQITTLKNKIKKENQAKKKFDLHKEVKRLEKELEENYGQDGHANA